MLKSMPPRMAQRMFCEPAWVMSAKNGSPDGAHAAEGEAPGDGAYEEADDVVPVEELEAVAGGELEGVGPAAPAEHGDDHEGQGYGVGFGLIHGASVYEAFSIVGSHPFRKRGGWMRHPA